MNDEAKRLAAKVATIDRQLTHLRNRRHRLVGMQLSSGGKSLMEANEVSREISQLELERGELTGR